MARVRSPNYPSMSLGDAVVKVAQIFGAEHRHPTPREVVAKHMGYSGVNGASLGAISALVKFGLLDQEGSDYRVSDLAIALTHPQSPEEKAGALNAAASKPALFAELLTQFKGKLPSDENLRAYLIRRGFNQSALNGCINAFRETMKLVSAESGISSSEIMAAMPSRAAHTQTRGPLELLEPSGATHRTQYHPASGAPPYRVSFIPNGGVEVSGLLTSQKSADEFIRAITALKLLLRPGDSAQPPAAEQGDESN